MIGLGGAGAAPVNTKNMPVCQAYNRNAPQLQGLFFSTYYTCKETYYTYKETTYTYKETYYTDLLYL